MSSADYSSILKLIVFTNSDQRIRAVWSAARRRLTTDRHVGDGRRRIVDGEVDDGEVDPLMWLDTDEPWSL